MIDGFWSGFRNGLLVALTVAALMLASGIMDEQDKRIVADADFAIRIQQIESNINRLEYRVLRPRFWQHCKTCANCRGDGQSEEGGPPSLCNEGFELWKEDMREAK